MFGSSLAQVGETGAALYWLEVSADRRFWNPEFIAERDPFHASLRSEPRFAAFVSEMRRLSNTFRDLLDPSA